MTRDLGEPADDGELEQRAADACAHQQHGAREGEGGELGGVDEGVEGLHVGAADEAHMASEMSGGEEEVLRGGDGVEAVAEAADLGRRRIRR